MAAISSGVARPAVSSITETRYCISDHLLWIRAPLAGGRSPCYEHLRPDPTPSPGCLSRLSGTPVENDPARRSHRWTPAPAPGAAGGFRRVASHLDLPIEGLRPPRWRA